MKIKFLILILLSLNFIACNNSETESTETIQEVVEKVNIDYIKEGKTIAENTFKVLSSNLQQAMVDGGIENALGYCNIKAMPLTDSLSKHYNVTIKRVSNKARNPLNQASENEQKILNNYLESIENRKPIISKNENANTSFYAPITTKGLCLNCHGIVGETLLPENHVKIQSLYPNDLATGYKIDELRGMWSIEFKN
ncbi:MAG: DUF3365 domain-containing protein [Vicingaceae bacterium]|nr:DUF3365 domain-containing protein [Vicingaceae bacterium]